MVYYRRFRLALSAALVGALVMVGLGAVTLPAAAASLTLDESTCASFGGELSGGDCRWYTGAEPLVVNAGDTLTVNVPVGYGAAPFTNNGTIALAADSFLTYDDQVNAGTFAVGSGATFGVLTGVMTNDGTFTLAAGSVLAIADGAGFANYGTITAACGATITGTVIGNPPVYLCDTVSSFAQPVDNLPTLNLAKAGSTIPLKFSVADLNGAPVTKLTGADVAVTSAPGGEGWARCRHRFDRDLCRAVGPAEPGWRCLPVQLGHTEELRGTMPDHEPTVGGGSQSAGFRFK